jgi:hypothetical protein
MMSGYCSDISTIDDLPQPINLHKSTLRVDEVKRALHVDDDRVKAMKVSESVSTVPMEVEEKPVPETKDSAEFELSHQQQYQQESDTWNMKGNTSRSLGSYILGHHRLPPPPPPSLNATTSMPSNHSHLDHNNPPTTISTATMFPRLEERRTVKEASGHSQLNCTPLYTACHFGNSEVVKLLLELGADINSKNMVIIGMLVLFNSSIFILFYLFYLFRMEGHH